MFWLTWTILFTIHSVTTAVQEFSFGVMSSKPTVELIQIMNKKTPTPEGAGVGAFQELLRKRVLKRIRIPFLISEQNGYCAIPALERLAQSREACIDLWLILPMKFVEQTHQLPHRRHCRIPHDR